MTRLVLVHGRQQQNLIATQQKERWISALRRGLDAQGMELTLDESDIAFAYYGDTLHALEHRKPHPQVVVKGDDSPNDAEAAFLADVLQSVVRHLGHDGIPEDVAIEKGLLSSPRVLELLRWLNAHHPEIGSALLALRTRDVYTYLTNQRVFSIINGGVKTALSRDEPNIVVAHSLGTVVAYSILVDLRRDDGWHVPLLVTLGSPLGVSPIRNQLAMVTHPGVVDEWLNAYDPLDVVALRPLDETTFATSKSIENYAGVANTASDHHGIEEYLSNPVVSARIGSALMMDR